METPALIKIQALRDLILLAEFENGEMKKYDMKSFVEKYPIYKTLQNSEVFNQVKLFGNYMVCWDEKLDLSSSVIWENGTTI